MLLILNKDILLAGKVHPWRGQKRQLEVLHESLGKVSGTQKVVASL